MPSELSKISGKLCKRLKKQLKTDSSLKNDGPAYLQVIGSGAHGAPKALYFFSDQTRYLFNVGEGTQRLAHEHKIKISQLEHIFITNPTWMNMGGLLGLTLTLQESLSSEIPKSVQNENSSEPLGITLHGPVGIDILFRISRSFIKLNLVDVKVSMSMAGATYSDSVVTISYVPLKSNKINENIKNSVDAKISNIHRSPEETGHDPEILIDELLSYVSMAYICQLKPILGKLNMLACKERKVPTGPLLGKLKSGEDVALPDGTIVKASEVKDPDVPGSIFIVIDCPDESFLDSLLAEELFVQFQRNERCFPKYIAHFTPSQVAKTERYQNWVRKFNEATVHIYVNDHNKFIGSTGYFDLQSKLHILDEKIFPSLPTEGFPFLPSEQQIVDEDYDSLNSIETPPLQCFTLRKMDHNCRNINIALEYPVSNVYLEEISCDKNFCDMMTVLKSELQSLSDTNEEPNLYPRITFLGTASCIPNTHRNSSGILVSLESGKFIILDCGEGTYGQLVRHFGYLQSQKILLSTAVIFISHMHADHHLGLITLLTKRRKAAKELKIIISDIIITAPPAMIQWLNMYDSIFEKILERVKVIPNANFNFKYKQESYHSEVLLATQLKDYSTCNVKHVAYSYGISFVDTKGIKITYSGDTEAGNENLIEMGMKSDLLIHEATFENALQGEAVKKSHSTFSGAIETREKMNANFVLLTHFSQRYAKIPLIDELYNDRVGIAFDNMEVSIGDLQKLPLFNKMYGFIFAEELLELKEKQLKRKKPENCSEQASEPVKKHFSNFPGDAGSTFNGSMLMFSS